MALTKPNQQLRRHLKAIAFNIEQSCVDLGKLAETLSDADAIALAGTLYEESGRLAGYADEVKDGQINRSMPEWTLLTLQHRPNYRELISARVHKGMW